MAAPATSILDSGAGSDANPIGGSWTQLSSTFCLNGFKRLSNQIRPIAQDAGAYWSATSYSADQEAFTTVTTLGTAGVNDYVRLIVRGAGLNGSSPTCYIFSWDGTASAGSYNWTLYRFITGTLTTPGSGSGLTLAAGDRIRFRAVGTSLVAYRNDTQIASVTDSGITAGGNLGTYDFSTVWALTNFGGGDICTISPALITPSIAAQRSSRW